MNDTSQDFDLVCQNQNSPHCSLIKENALVVGVKNGLAMCRIPVYSACAGCHSKCIMSGEMKERAISVAVPKGMHCQPGDYIDLRVDSGFITRASFMLYLAPALILLVFAWLGRSVALSIGLQDPDLGSLLAVFISVPLHMLIITWTRKKMGGVENIHIITRSRKA